MFYNYKNSILVIYDMNLCQNKCYIYQDDIFVRQNIIVFCGLSVSISPLVAMTQLAIIPFPPGVHITISRQGKAVFPSRVDGNFTDHNVLNGLQECWCGDRLYTTNAQPTSCTITSCINLCVEGNIYKIQCQEMSLS